MSSPLMLKIHLCGSAVIIKSTKTSLSFIIAIFLQHIPVIVMQQPGYIVFYNRGTVRNRPATEPVTLKVHNIKLSFDI